MSIEPEILNIDKAVQALVQPINPNPAFYAPYVSSDLSASSGLSLSNVARLEDKTQKAGRAYGALVIPPEEVLGARNCAKIRQTRHKILEAISNNRNAILLRADNIVLEGKFEDITSIIDRKPTNNQSCINFVFENQRTLSAPFCEEAARATRCRVILVDDSLIPSAVLCGRIMDLIDAHFGDASIQHRPQFIAQLEDIIRRQPLDRGIVDRVIDPGSGLEFYPVPKGQTRWSDYAKKLPRSSKAYTRDPIGFLLNQYSLYLERGLLYSGHIKHSDKDLYDSIRMSCGISKRFRSLDEFFAHHDILTSADLSNPPQEKRHRAKTILDINIALAGRKAVLGQVVTHQKRGMSPARMPARMRLMTNDPE